MNLYSREQRQVAAAIKESQIDITDEFANTDEESRDDASSTSTSTHHVLSCGVEKCPSADTVWPSEDRLQKHRYRVLSRLYIFYVFGERGGDIRNFAFWG